MAAKKKDCAKDLLAITNPFSVHRKSQVLRWSVMVGLLICGVVAALLYYVNTTGRFGR